jgi:hypothetical protein
MRKCQRQCCAAPKCRTYCVEGLTHSCFMNRCTRLAGATVTLLALLLAADTQCCGKLMRAKHLRNCSARKLQPLH